MVHVGNGSSFPISSFGSSYISTSIKPLLLKNVQHVPDITKKIFYRFINLLMIMMSTLNFMRIFVL